MAAIRAEPLKVVKYKSVKGDAVDEEFGKALQKHNCQLPVKRLSPGKYMFGQRQIIAKIINSKLVIRVGGGYMSVDEFIEQYGKIEMIKMLKAEHPASKTPKGLNTSKGFSGSKDEKTSLSSKAMGVGDVKEMLRETINNVADDMRRESEKLADPKYKLSLDKSGDIASVGFANISLKVGVGGQARKSDTRGIGDQGIDDSVVEVEATTTTT